MDSLRLKLESQGLRDIAYMVINHQGAQAQRLHPLLAEKLSANITLYKQADEQPDVWQILRGEKDDFFIYDRCGRLTQHISLPYSILGHGHVEKAIRDTYCTRICGECTHESSEIPEECKEKPVETPPTDPAVIPPPGHGRHGHHHGRHHHGHRHHPHHHHHHGNHQQGQHRLNVDQVGVVETQQDLGLAQAPIRPEVVMQRPWVQDKANCKSKHSWQWSNDNTKSTWCWHWRRLFEGAVNGEGSMWHCEEGLPASWQWHTAQDASVKETWQCRAPPTDWLQTQQAWNWPMGDQSWQWQAQN